MKGVFYYMYVFQPTPSPKYAVMYPVYWCGSIYFIFVKGGYIK